MFRNLEDLANATPKDYLAHAPDSPTSLAFQMIQKASSLFPNGTATVESSIQATNFTFLFVGPGSGQIVKFLIDQGHMANGLETSKRGIATSDPLVISYVNWSKPWETPYGNRYFDVALLSKYYKTILNPHEWAETVKEIKRVSKYSALI